MQKPNDRIMLIVNNKEIVDEAHYMLLLNLQDVSMKRRMCIIN